MTKNAAQTNPVQVPAVATAAKLVAEKSKEKEPTRAQQLENVKAQKSNGENPKKKTKKKAGKARALLYVVVRGGHILISPRGSTKMPCCLFYRPPPMPDILVCVSGLLGGGGDGGDIQEETREEKEAKAVRQLQVATTAGLLWSESGVGDELLDAKTAASILSWSNLPEPKLKQIWKDAKSGPPANMLSKSEFEKAVSISCSMRAEIQDLVCYSSLATKI